MITKRECDIPMARSKKLLPCDKDCKNCMACIETTDTGERRHCRRHKKTNFAIDLKLATIGLESEELLDTPAEAEKVQARWTETEEKRLLFLKRQGLNCKQIATKMGKTKRSVIHKLRRMKEREEV